jgi:hypothetical protein
MEQPLYHKRGNMQIKDIKTKSDLRYMIMESGSHFFDHSSMKFFGDTMANYGMRSTKISGIEYFELYRRKTVKHGLNTSSYFRKTDLSKTTNPFN